MLGQNRSRLSTERGTLPRWTIKSRSRDLSVNRCANCALFADVMMSAAIEKARCSVRDDSRANFLRRGSRALRGE